MRYWLFKSEPDEFGIGHLQASPNETARWDGVRNYQARNFLRDEISLKDRVLFYHSSCAEPAIAGFAEVVRKAYPDPSQFDRTSPWYDPKSTQDNPRWYAVDIRFLCTLVAPLRLRDIREAATLSGNALADFLLLTRPRLSIMPVSPAHLSALRALGLQLPPKNDLKSH